MADHDHVGLRNGRTRPDGGPSLEYIAATRLGEHRFRLLDSPWTLFGCASNDIVEIGPAEGEWTVVERGGRVSVQFFVRENDVGSCRALEPLMTSIGGTLDNMSRSGQAYVYSFPASLGQRRVVAIMEQAKERYPDIEWCYGNVYPAESNEPLEWARDYLSR